MRFNLAPTAPDALHRLCVLPFLDGNPWLDAALKRDGHPEHKYMEDAGFARALMETFLALRAFELDLETANSLLARIAPDGAPDLKQVRAQVEKLVRLMQLSPTAAMKLLDIAHGHTLDGALRSALSVIAASQGNSDPGETLGKFV